MPFCLKEKICFIHIQKTGGTSIREWLMKQTRSRAFGEQIYYMNDDELYHNTALEFKKLNCYYDSYFSFSFLRNPLERVVSFYEFVKSSKRHAQTNPNHANSIKKMSFDEFMFSSFLPPPQANYVCDQEGKLIVDFLGKLENIENDIKYLESRLGWPHIPIKKINTTYISHAPYRTYYNNDKTRSQAETFYKDDIKMFNRFSMLF